MGKPKKHKRGKPKSSRAGCGMCKPEKRQGTSKARKLTASEKRKLARMGIEVNGNTDIYE